VSKVSVVPLNNTEEAETLRELSQVEALLRKLDPNSNHFCVNYGWCKIDKNDIKRRTDVAEVDYIDKSGSKFRLSKDEEMKPRDKYFCKVKLSGHKPLNMIYPYCGYDLNVIIQAKYFKNKSEQLLTLYNIVKNNIKQVLWKLLLGLKIMHENNIIHHDIKCENIMIHSTSTSGSSSTSGSNKNNISYKCLYGDFGFSMLLDQKTKRELNDEIYEGAGTMGYFPPEVYCLGAILDYRYESNMSYVLKKAINTYRYENLETLDEYGLKKMGVSLEVNDIARSLLPFITRMRTELFDNRYYNSYYNKTNLRGYIYLNDIYALGIVFSAIYNVMKIDITDDIKTLVKGMTAFNPDDRYNIYDCINHPIFNDIRENIKAYKQRNLTKKILPKSIKKNRKSHKRISYREKINLKK
jgi:serine/threonine protein kinase